MKAMVFTEYGLPDVLHLQEVEKPVPKEYEVLIEVRAASVNSWDWELLRGKPFLNRMVFGLTRPKKVQILGVDVAGQVAAVGRGVTHFAAGDKVFGDISGGRWGGFAEYVCAHEDILARKPAAMTFEQAAAIPQAGVLALQGLRKGEIRSGQKILLNGAGGGVGTFAVQIAKAIGVDVTGVDRGSKLEVVRRLGADHVLDYTHEDFTRNGRRYDLILDVVGSRSVFDYRRALSPTGSYVMVGGSGSTLIQVLAVGGLISMSGSQTLGLLIHVPERRDLDTLVKLFKEGKVAPVIDRTYPLAELPEALRYFGEGGACGKVVISVRQ